MYVADVKSKAGKEADAQFCKGAGFNLGTVGKQSRNVGHQWLKMDQLRQKAPREGKRIPKKLHHL